MSEFDRGRERSGSHARSISASQHSPSNIRSYRLDEAEQEAGGSRAFRGDGNSRQQDSDHYNQGDYLSPLVSTSRRARGRVDSLTSVGSSVAPAALPRWQSRHHQASTRQYQHQQREGSGSHRALSPSVGNNGTGGLEAWLQTQAVTTGGNSSSSFAPSSRIRRMNAVDETEIGSDAGRSTGAKSAGPFLNGTGSGRRSRENRSRPSIPEWDPSSLDADAAGLGGVASNASDHYNQKLDTVLRWRSNSVAKSATKERIDVTDYDSQIAPEARRRRREAVGPASFSTSGLSVLREGVRRPRKSSAEPSLDALLSASRSDYEANRIPSSRSFKENLANHSQEPLMQAKSKELEEEDGEDPSSSPLRNFVRWFLFEGVKNNNSTGPRLGPQSGASLIFVFAILLSTFLKWCTGLGSWSGRGKAPMYGDLEAQRHWMEITLHLPRSQWYFYDLPYWGLDYPPLTALVSQWCAQIAVLFPALRPSFELDTSRGNEAYLLIIYMRATVLVLDLVIYTPSVLFFLSRKLQGRGRRTRAIAAVSILIQPSLLLVDYGHFQYNTVMLGLSTTAFSLLYTSLPNLDLSSCSTDVKVQQGVQRRIASLSRRISYEYIAAAVFFSLSLCFKQMALYFAPAIFAIMLGRCWGLARIRFERGLLCFLFIGMATVFTFAVLFQPWITNLNQLGQIIHRIFPIARGIFEDKVSNFWCFLSVLPIPARYKLRNVISGQGLAKLSLVTTILVIIFPCVHLFAAASETVHIEMFLDQDIKRQIAASEKRKREGSVAGSSRARKQRHANMAPSDAGTEIASILSANRGGGGRTSSVIRGTETRINGSTGRENKVVSASSSPSPAASVLPYALLSTSLAFFLFGFQTHEKSILLPLLPATLLLTSKADEWGAGAGKTDWEWTVLMNNLAVFSMWPLLQRDGLCLQYAILILLWNWAIGHRPFAGLRSYRHTFVAWFGAITHLGMIFLHIVEMVFPLLPTYTTSIIIRYPDLFAVLNVLLCTPCLILIWFWSLKRQLEVGFACGIDIFYLQSKTSSPSSSSSLATSKAKTAATTFGK